MKNNEKNHLSDADRTVKQKQLHGKAVLAIVLGAAVLLVSSLNGCGFKKENTTGSSATEQSQSIDNTISWKGKKYTYNTDLTNILFLGIDTSDPIATENTPGESGQSDCVMLLSLNNKTVGLSFSTSCKQNAGQQQKASNHGCPNCFYFLHIFPP